MRPFFLRATLLGGLLAATVAVAQPAAPRAPAPDAKKLKDELDALLKERDALAKQLAPDSAPSEKEQLEKKLQDLLERIAKKPPAPPQPAPVEKLPPPQPAPATDKKPKTDPLPDGFTPIDPLRAAQNLFKGNEVEAAYRALAMLKPDALTRDDRVFAQYLSACCLRKLGKVSDAAVIFRELATAKEDDFLTQCSLWQLAAIRASQELEEQLGQLRAKPKAK